MRPEWNGDRIRDDYEISLLRSFMALKKPVLGVCRGAQVINVGLGGTLYQDLATQVPHSLNHRNWQIYEQNCHATSLVPNSGLARLYRETSVVKTNSIHHQAVKDLGRDLIVEAWSEPDRVVEAIRYTGPAYVFLVMEALIDAAVHIGFPRHIAHDLVIETLEGSARFAKHSGDHPAVLRNAVTSPAGTSAAAIHELESGRLRTVLSEAVWAAFRRTVELGDQIDAQLVEPKTPADT